MWRSGSAAAWLHATVTRRTRTRHTGARATRRRSRRAGRASRAPDPWAFSDACLEPSRQRHGPALALVAGRGFEIRVAAAALDRERREPRDHPFDTARRGRGRASVRAVLALPAGAAARRDRQVGARRPVGVDAG